MPEANVKSGALLGFKVGLQSTVDTMLAAGSSAGADHGCFYLTKDSHRLYVGNEDGSLSAVNEGIQTVTWSELSTIASTAASTTAGTAALTGRFYYASDKNVLCVYNGTNWVQLNENSNTYIESNTYTVTTANNASTITNTLKDNDNQEISDSFSVTGANGIKITSSGKVITLTGDTYTLSSVAGSITGTVDIKLDSTETNNDSKITLESGANVQLSRNATTGNINIAATDTVVDSVDVTAESSGFKFTVGSTDNSSVQDTIDPKVAVYTSSDPNSSTTNSVSFINGTATLDVYSRAAVDSKLKAVNAMTYRGTVGSGSTDVASSITYDSNTGITTIAKNGTVLSVSIGDTFLMTTAGTYHGIAYKENSLFIVRAKEGKTEDANGIIASGDFICDIVEEKYDGDTHYTLQDITNGIQLHSNLGDDVGALVVTAGTGNNWIDVTETKTGAGVDYVKTLTVLHKNVTRTDTTGTTTTQGDHSNLTIPVITRVTSDAKGHITGIQTTDYIVKDTNATLTSMSTTTSAYNDTTNNYNAGVINTSTTLTGSDSQATTKTSSVVLSSSSLTISDEDTRPTALGGSVKPGGLKIEMTWGSF